MVFCKDLKSGPIFEWVRSISQTRVGHFMIITQRNILGKENICCEKSMKSRESLLLKRKSEIQANSAAKCLSNWVFKQMKQESHFLPLNHSTAVTRQIFRWCIYTNSYPFRTRSHSNYLLFICYCLYFSDNLLNHEGKYWTYSWKFLLQERLKIYTFVNKIIWTHVTHHVIYMSFVSFKFLFFPSLRLRFYVHI